MKTSVFLRVGSTSKNLNIFITPDENVYGIHWKSANFLFILFYCLHTIARFWRHNLRHQTNHERHGVNF